MQRKPYKIIDADKREESAIQSNPYKVIDADKKEESAAQSKPYKVIDADKKEESAAQSNPYKVIDADKGEESATQSKPDKVIDANKMFRRFERSEVILHWANAVPFLILFITGALNILSRFVAFLPSFLWAIRTTHKIVGALWLVSIGYSFFFVGRQLNIANLRDQICMGFSDIAWMIRAFRSVYNPHVTTPPAGKFNPGQKINAVLVVLYAIVFAGSGALMWAYNTMLLPWFVHVSVFFMAVSSVGGHLYLSFLHPSTRPGLKGIFNGMVPRSYVLHHHSLMIPGAAHAHQTPAPAGGVFMKVEIVILVLAMIGGGFGVEVIGTMPRPDLKRGFESLVTPGDLSKAHSIKEIDNCKKCHEYSGEIPEKNCLSCHKLIQARIDASLGNHGKKQEKCIHCHKEHPGGTGTIINFDKEKFDHAAAAFKLEGKHKEAKCEKCHKRKISEGGNNPAGYYVGLRYDTCLDCHKDEHAGKFGEKKCEDCHSPAGWNGKDLKFDHNTAKFRLEGKHSSAACDKCHKPQTPGAALGKAAFKGIKFSLCTDCHRKDPHQGKLRAECSSCHSPQGWRGEHLKFDHSRSANFKLEGKHESVKCSKCHKATTKNGLMDVSSFKLRHQSCADCHKDPHRKEIAAACSTCHSVQGWRGEHLKFDHNRSAKFRLEGKHESVKCNKCHKATTKEGLMDVSSFKLRHQSCGDCHKDPHRREIAAACSSCHSVQGWRGKDLKFDHVRDEKFRLEGKHESVKCFKCHKVTTKDGLMDVSSFKLKHQSCADCHKDPHRGELRTECVACHSAQGWRGNDLKFDHVRNAKFRLEGKHLAVKCVKCHKATTKDGLLEVTSFKISNSETCGPCHKNKHKEKFAVTCDKCHNSVSWKAISWKKKKS